MRFVDPTEAVRRMHINSGHRVADLGAGSGHYTVALAERVGDEGMVYAIDIQRDLLRKIANMAREQGTDRIETLWGDIDEVQGIPLADNTVDVAVLSNTLFQLENKETAFAEVARILKAKGRVFIIEWSESFAGIGPSSDLVVPKETARAYAADAGLVVEEEFEPGAHHYGLMARKKI